MYDHVLLHYGEIGTKGGNRAFFEKALVRNVARAVRPWGEAEPRRESGRIVFALAGIAPESHDAAIDAVARTPGVEWVTPAVRTAPTVEALRDAAVALARRGAGSFKIQARRAEKQLPFDSMDLNREIGAAVAAATGRAVDVHEPAVEYRVEVDTKAGYVHDAKRHGPGGLPTGTAGRALVLLSGGIDSPVAAWRMMVRGCEVSALHLWNRTFSGDGVREKVLDLSRALARHQGFLQLQLVPFEDIQQAVIAASPAELRMLLYRRAMLHVANAVRREERALATVVGDAVGQVASQTLPNLAAVYDAAEPPVLTPLIGENKMDTVRTAQRIGTFDVSIRPGEDCCGLLVAKHPATSATAVELREIESRLDLGALVGAALAARERHRLEPPRIAR
jgi:thiamine biosynthesis protein ThiI